MRSVVLHIALSILRVFVLCSFTAADLFADYKHFAIMDELGRYKLYWSTDIAAKLIYFAVEVRTTGWVGFGISSGNGKMKGSDLVIGWVKDCKGYLADHYADGNSVPVLDKHQDYELTGFSEKDGTTIIRFNRKLDTCDSRDGKIEEGTTKVVYAYTTSDPHSPADFIKHSVKGQRSLLLLNSWQGSESLPSNMKYFDVRVDKIKVPGKDTTYWCQGIKLPTFDRKYHIVMVKPRIQEGHNGLVHHILVYKCKPSFDEKALSYSGDCSHPTVPADFKQCEHNELAAGWAIGSEGFIFPRDVGLPIGEANGAKVLLLQIHYNNPLKKSGYVDSSGLRFYYTEPRKYESAVMENGIVDLAKSFIVPPKQKSWLTSGYCPQRCTKEGFTDTGLPGGGIKVFAVLLHTHFAGRKIWVKHIRDGKQLPDIARDNNYDPSFQETRTLQKELTVLPGDELITECIYNTMDRARETVGGQSAKQEMCTAFLLYYPRSSLVLCGSGEFAATKLFRKEFGITKKTRQPLTWDNAMVGKLRELYDWLPNTTAQCFFSSKSKPVIFRAVKPKITTPLKKQDLICTVAERNSTTYMDSRPDYCGSDSEEVGTDYLPRMDYLPPAL